MQFEPVIEVACQVKPEWDSEIRQLSEDDYSKFVLRTLGSDLSNTEQRVAYTLKYFDLSDPDISVLSTKYGELENVTDSAVWTRISDDLIRAVDNFTLPAEEKDRLKNSLTILRSSFQLWNEV